ncbi:MAG TPA: hypothetical protein VNL17_02335 [Verrucomicrobiae bacterium]|nr:hypothetical protein [Verrucomicrobiae bacterium]
MRNNLALLAISLAAVYNTREVNAQSICASVPATAANGVSFGSVAAGQTYTYQASGAAGYNFDGCQSDPDGNIVAGACGPAIGDNGFNCPGLKAFSLVGKVNGQCIQLGSGGTFVAPSSGPLTLYYNDSGYGDNSGGFSACVTSTQIQQNCTSVSGAAAAGVSFGSVVAGQTYSYQASGAVGYNFDGCQSDPDGNIVAGACGPATGDNSFKCPGLKAFSLVGKINGQCLQLGSSGAFVASSSGTLTLYYNDSGYGDNSGSFSVCITPVSQTCATVLGTTSGGLSYGNVVAGQTYSYQALGVIGYNSDGCQADPDGNIVAGACSPATADGSFTCPGLKAFSLVAKVNGQCLQLGSGGTFVAPSSGPLILYFNDSIYGDNSGSWNVCITPVQQSCPTVPGNSAAGASFGSIVAGQTYSYQASGTVGFNLDGCQSDPDGNIVAGACQPATADNSFTCPGLKAFSLVGKINGQCLQLGTSGTFLAPASGTLTLVYNDSGYGDNGGSFSVCIKPVQQACPNVPGSATGGAAYGSVIAGQTYSYHAYGVIGYNLDGCQSDPDGNIVAGACAPAVGDGSFTCPGLKAFSLVGKVNGQCIQLGTSGQFSAPASGPLTLYFNDSNYGDNSGSWSVCITPVQQACANLPASASGGVPFGNVVAGQPYGYQASGKAGFNLDGCQSDPDGNIVAGACAPAIADDSFTCPGLKAFSLVGKVNGQCIQLGASGQFSAPASGPLTLYFNDSGYGDNSGSWNVCLEPLPEAVRGIAVEGKNIRVSWTTVAGRTCYLQASTNKLSGSFADISPAIYMPILGSTTTNYLDQNGALQGSARYYRVRITPQ